VTRLTVERLFSSPALNGVIPQQVRFSPDGQQVTYLANPPDDRERLDLYCYDIAVHTTRRLIDSSSIATTGFQTDAEKAERERRRAFDAGVSHYRWLPDAKRIAALIDGAVYLCSGSDGASARITAAGLRQTDLAVSGTGRYLSYVRGGNLFIHDLATGAEEQLTYDVAETVSNGVADFIAQEEMHRFEGHWWSADDRHLAFTRVDSSAIPVSHRYEFTATELQVYPQRYPFAGANNALVQLGIIDIPTRAIRWLEYRDQPEDYLARVNVGAGVVVVQVQRRDQRLMTVKSFPFDGGPAHVLLTEQQPCWVNLHNNFRFVGGGPDFLWTSERSGSAQLYLYRKNDVLELGDGRGRVNEVVYADADQAYVLGWTDTPTEQHLLRVTYDATTPAERLTDTPAWHDAIVDPKGRWIVDRFSSVDQPHCILLRDSGGDQVNRILAANALTEGHPYHPYLRDHVTPTFGSIEASDSQPLWYRLTLPQNFDPARRWPVLINVYGGPGVQRVRNEWAPLTLQLFAAAGIAIFELDNRGSGNRTKSFEDPIFGRLGLVEAEDQLAGLRHLTTLPWVDADRIGVMGHSYGGFMALMLMARSAGAIRAGISSAPVTDWRLYDTHYTERYLGTPARNPHGYRNSSIAEHLDTMSGSLLLIHGMADDNVLFSNTTTLMHTLQQRRFPFELMLYPGAKHALQERDVAIHRYDTILDFLRRRLLA
jgi:dipeptidyl-peptidase 4